MDPRTLIYLYGIVREDAPEPDDDLRGLDDRPVRLAREAGVAAVVSDVDSESYTETALNERLGDLAWVGERGAAHERVLTWFADRGPVIPLALFSLYRDPDRLHGLLTGGAEQYRGVLDALRGRREWGVKLWRVDRRLDEHLVELSPRIAEFSAEMSKAPPGKRYLLAKQRDAALADERRIVGSKVARTVFTDLEAVAERGVRLAISAVPENEEKTIVLYAAFLVEDSQLAEFQQRVSRAAHKFGAQGFELEFTGPWPPYHFAVVHDS